jgi:hypothetical protein
MEDVVLAFIPIIGLTGLFLWALSNSPVGKALADRLRNGPRGNVPTDVGESVASLRQQVAELAERVDFAERLLAKQQEAARLERPR